MASIGTCNTNIELLRLFSHASLHILSDPSLETFLKYLIHLQFMQLFPEFESYNKQVEELKEIVRGMLMASERDPIQNIEFINLLSLLGVLYHFENEIEDQVKHVFEVLPNLLENNDCDLYITALLFRVLRERGYKVTSDVFMKFKDSNNEFKDNIVDDGKGMLSLYEAAYLSMHGEDILSEALEFTRKNLEYMATTSSPRIAKHIKNTLLRPIHRSEPRIEARKYICFYEDDDSCIETLLKFAKLDFNRLQLLHQHELSIVSRWAKVINFPKEFPYARDRIAEVYFWVSGIQFEPQYSYARIVCTKATVLFSVMDDTYDAYATYEELQPFTKAMNRCDIGAIDQLPEDYLKVLFRAFISFFNELENYLSTEGRSNVVYYVKKTIKELASAYLVEARWCNDHCVPPLEEYLDNGKISSAFVQMIAAFFVGVKDAGIEEYERLTSKTKAVEAGNLFLRLANDMLSHEYEQKRGHCPSAVECYMKEYGVSEKEAVKELQKIYENAWKDMNEVCMRPTDISMHHINMYVNLGRITDVIYEYDDAYTMASSLKDRINSLFVEKIPL